MTPKVSNEYKTQKKKEILLHAKNVFKRKGFEPTTMKDIKEEANISFGGLYMYFSNTEEIFLQLLELEFEANDEALAIHHSNSIWEQIQLFLQHQKADLKNMRDTLIPISYEYFVTAWREKHRVPFLENRYHVAKDKFTTLLKMGVANGEFTPTISIEDLSKLLISTLEGLNVSALFLEEDIGDFDKQLDALQKLLELALQVQEK
ncbi:TetR family transcriptional regulator [Ureibacillus xyleni]|uniref:TetR family transcriptional regulator n=1 Tax=Ureibacillus xyleni TaxID=614648 RepID=A0A285RYD8_9BACL|nr:TetR family transcriptional regulator [Ureibacillus xyleni]SOB99477.1 TetR family transcriptional regulator [Ureibacillus xyleni]